MERFEREGGYTIAPRVDAVLQGLGFDPTAARAQPLAIELLMSDHRRVEDLFEQFETEKESDDGTRRERINGNGATVGRPQRRS